MIEPDDLENWVRGRLDGLESWVSGRLDDEKIDMKRDVRHPPGEGWMTPAGLKCALGFLGVSTAWLGERCGTHQRTVVRWCDGKSPVSKLVAAELDKILADTADAFDTLRDNVEADATGTVVLYTYRTDQEFWRARPDRTQYPASWHRTLVARLADGLARSTTFSVRIQYEDAA